MGQIPEAICWFEGMQLLPQHFQQQSLRAETLAAFYTATAQPCFWGVLQLDIDEAALISGKLRVLSLEAIMPDGLWVCIKPGVHAPLELDLKAPVLAGVNRIATLCLVVPPLYRAGTLDASGRRYITAEGRDIPDLASQEAPVTLTLWRPDLMLAGEEQRGDGVSLPLLRVGEMAGGFTRVPYFAPQPRVLPESLLGQRISTLCEAMREKCLFLSGRLRLALQANNEGDISRLNRQLAALWARLPELQSLLDSRVAHPLSLYLVLSGMAGSVCALNPINGVPAFSPFNYQELLSGFNELIGFLSGVIAKIRAGYRSFVFERRDTGFAIQPPLSLKGAAQWVIGLRMPNGLAEDAARLWLGQAVIGSASQQETLQKLRMRGISCRPLDRQEQASYSVGDDTRLFMLSDFGEWLKEGEPLVVAGPVQAEEPWEIVLFAPDNGDSIPVLSEAEND